MSSERFLVTGALGCIGAWTCRLLVEEGVPVVGYDLGSDPHRLKLIMSPEQLGQVTLVPGDVTDLDQLLGVLGEHEISNVVHLAGLQLPFCRADPPLGARVNVVGTVSAFEAAKRHALKTAIAYASTSAVYDEAGAINPQSHYGVYKVANEGTAHAYWQDDGIPSIGLRPFCDTPREVLLDRIFELLPQLLRCTAVEIHHILNPDDAPMEGVGRRIKRNPCIVVLVLQQIC